MASAKHDPAEIVTGATRRLRHADQIDRAFAQRDLFKGALGELRNPKAHGDPTINDTLIAVEEMMTASALLRILDGA